MAELKNYLRVKYDGLCNYLERDTVGTQLAIYGTSTLMLIVAYVKRKPAYLVRQFKKPQHIPDLLINERVVQTGLIKAVLQRDQDTLLLIKHRPLIPIFTSNKKLLSVKLPGVKVNSNGYSWLQTCLVGREAAFLPLKKCTTQDYVVCQLKLLHSPKSTKQFDVSEILLRLRFAKYIQDAEMKSNTKYYKHLQQIERSTNKRESWLAWAARYPIIWKAFNDLRVKLLPKQQLLPELVRR